MAKLELSKTPFSLSRIPHWLAPVSFAFSVIAVVAVLLTIITFIATAVSDASLVVDPPTPDSTLDTKKLSRIGSRIGLDGISMPGGGSGTGEEASSSQDEDITEEPDTTPIEVPEGGPQ